MRFHATLTHTPENCPGPRGALGVTAVLVMDWFLTWKYPLYLLHYSVADFPELVERVVAIVNLIFTAGGNQYLVLGCQDILA